MRPGSAITRFEEISSNLAQVNERIGVALTKANRGESSLTLIAVTKTFPTSDAAILHELGLRNFGENRDEEGARKSQELEADITWHFQGQVQSRKIPSISHWARYVHSLDELSHAAKFLQQSSLPEFFIQVNLEEERPDRGGVRVGELDRFIGDLPEEIYARAVGLMAVAPIDQEADMAFGAMATLSARVRANHPAISGLSIGMSGDFESAIIHGATHIRIGSSILGSRKALA